MKYKSFVKEIGNIKEELNEIKEKQDEFIDSLLSYNYNINDFEEEALDIGI